MSSHLQRDEALEKEDRIDEMKKIKNSPPLQHLMQAQQAPALPYAKVVGPPGTGSYPAPSPDPTTHNISWTKCLYCWYSLESWTNEYPQHAFMENQRKLFVNYHQIPSLSVPLHRQASLTECFDPSGSTMATHFTAQQIWKNPYFNLHLSITYQQRQNFSKINTKTINVYCKEYMGMYWMIIQRSHVTRKSVFGGCH